MTDKQKEIIQKHWSNPLMIGGVQDLQKRIPKMMDEWGVEIIKWLRDCQLDFSQEPPSPKELYDEFILESKIK